MIEDLLGAILDARSGAAGTRPFVVGIAGGVGVGKTTLATQLAEQLVDRGVSATVLATDNFLLTNDELGRRGWLMQKGFPDTYDLDLLRAAIADLRAGRIAVVPLYSHQAYDRSDDTLAVAPTDVLLLEGVNVLQPEVHELLDVSVYIDVDEAFARQWFFDRFEALATKGQGFYAAFTGMTGDERRDIAESAWTGINLVNLREHIAPTRERADLVLRKAADHSVISLRQR